MWPLCPRCNSNWTNQIAEEVWECRQCGLQFEVPLPPIDSTTPFWEVVRRGFREGGKPQPATWIPLKVFLFVVVISSIIALIGQCN